VSRLTERAALVRLTERGRLAGYRSGWFLVRRMPARVAYRLFDLIADVAWRRGGKGVSRMRSNYQTVRPELNAAEVEVLVRAGMRSYLRYWCDSFRLPDRSVEDLVRGVRVVGDEPVRARLQSGRSAVMFLGHLGNWDFGGAWSTTQLGPVTTVAERLKPEELFDEFLAFRERLGMRIIPLTGGSDVFRELTDFSYPAIGREFGGRDHSTVMHAVEKIGGLMKERHQIYNQVTDLIIRIKSGS